MELPQPNSWISKNVRETQSEKHEVNESVLNWNRRQSFFAFATTYEFLSKMISQPKIAIKFYNLCKNLCD